MTGEAPNHVDIEVGGQVLAPLTGVIEQARQAVTAGARALWWPDHLMGWFPSALWSPAYGAATDLESPDAVLDPFVMAGAVAASVPLQRVGTVVTDPFRRHPAVLLQAAATVASLGVDFALGIGSGAYENLDPYGLGGDGRYRQLVDAVEVIRALIDADSPTSYEGTSFHLSDALAAIPSKRRVTVWIGGNGSRYIRLAAQRGDGWIPTRLAPAAYAEQVDMLRDLSAAEHRTAPVASMFVWSLVATDHEAAHRLMRAPFLKALLMFRGAAYFEQLGLRHPLLEVTGRPEYIPARLSVEQAERAVGMVPDDALHEYIVHGSAAEVRAEAEELGRHGLQHLITYDLARFVEGGAAVSAIEQLLVPAPPTGAPPP
jgi:phthiodiolone/phenolphthiodiolone dimycocerosates ketoreductase